MQDLIDYGSEAWPSLIIGTVRGSSWGTILDCGLRWSFAHIDGLRNPNTGASCTGTAIHAGTALFDTARMNGEEGDVNEAVEETLAWLKDPQEEVAWLNRSEQKAAELIAIKLTTKYCLQIAPTREYVAVEMPCEPMQIRTRYGIIVTTGMLDRVRRVPDVGLGVSDVKSGKRAVSIKQGKPVATTTGHHLQVGIYTLMAEHSSGQLMQAPSEIIGLQTTGDALVATAEMPDVKTALLGTEKMPGVIDIAAKMLKEGFFPPNPKSAFCSQRYCDGYSRCPYHG